MRRSKEFWQEVVDTCGLSCLLPRRCTMCLHPEKTQQYFSTMFLVFLLFLSSLCRKCFYVSQILLRLCVSSSRDPSACCSRTESGRDRVCAPLAAARAVLWLQAVHSAAVLQAVVAGCSQVVLTPVELVVLSSVELVVVLNSVELVVLRSVELVGLNNVELSRATCCVELRGN